MKKIFLTVLVLFSGCQGETVKKCLSPTWIEQTKASIIQNNHKGEIIKYQFKNEEVYLVKECLNCTDFIQEVRNCEGKTICVFGGFAGQNTCPDFSQAVLLETVWKN